MPTWSSEQYLKFANERTQPAIDLCSRIALSAPQRVIDLGCGPGNSTAVVGQRWPNAEIRGLDNSPAMLVTARRDFPQWQWEETDIGQWAENAAKSRIKNDLLFSNAALQWVPDHANVISNLFAATSAGGALAFQIPHNLDAPPQYYLRELAAKKSWRNRFTRQPVSWHVEPAEFYYDTLAPRSSRVDLWFTEYAHVLSGPEGVVEWYRGTGLRPFLDALPDESARDDFIGEYLEALQPHYPRRGDGKVIMYFRRLFVIAYR